MPPKNIPTKSVYINSPENAEYRKKEQESDIFFIESGLSALEDELRLNKKRQDNKYNDILAMDDFDLKKEIKKAGIWYNIEKSNLEEAISRNKEILTILLGEINSIKQDIKQKKKGFSLFNCFLAESVKILEDVLAEKNILYKNVHHELQRLNIDYGRLEKTHNYKLLINELKRRKKIAENARQRTLSGPTLTRNVKVNTPLSQNRHQEKEPESTVDGMQHPLNLGNQYSIHQEKQPGLPGSLLTRNVNLNTPISRIHTNQNNMNHNQM